jgi:acetyl esterase/lipase
MTLKTRLSICLAATLALAACAPVSILNGITPSSTFDRTKNLAYGDGPRQTLDVYAVENPKADAPVLVFIHGGSWDSGKKGIYKFLAEGFTKSGYDVVVPNYRLWPDAKFPNFLNDNAKAVAFAADRYPDRKIVLMGHSAGGYNVLMLGLDDQYLSAAGVDRCERISGVVGLAAPVGIVPLKAERLVAIFPERLQGTDSALNAVTGPSPALFLGHGEADTTVYPQNSLQLAEKVTARGGVAQAEIYPEQSHTDVVKVLSRHFDGDANLKSDIVKFLDGLPVSGATCR